MKIVKQGWSIAAMVDTRTMLQNLEDWARVCYQSQERNVNKDFEVTKTFLRNIMKQGHLGVLEHAIVTMRVITNRGISHQQVRHRLVSYLQESTKYCNYSKDQFGNEIKIVLPLWFYGGFEENPSEAYKVWKDACEYAEKSYFKLLELGQSPEQAREVLPNSLKTEYIMTLNLRELRHIFSLRTSKKAHPQIRHLMNDMLAYFKREIPVIFDDMDVIK